MRTDLVREVMVERIASLVREREPGGDAATLGYAARIVETELFAAAREPMPWLTEQLETAGPELLAARLAAAEPLERPDPGSAVASWRVPGPGGHVRHYLALALVEREGKREFLRGFFRRCCEEAA